MPGMDRALALHGEMVVIEEITDFASDLGHLTPNQREIEAVVAILVLVMHADDKVALDEVRFIDAVEDGCEWSGQMGLAQYVAKKRIEAVAALKDDDKLDSYINRAVYKLATPDIQRPLYLLADQLANADRGVDEREMRVLEKLVAAFEEAAP